MIQRLYSAQAQGEITFTLTYLLQLRLCVGGLPYQLRIRFVPGSVPFEESEKHPCVQEMFFSHRNKQDSRLQECSALVESLVCKHFSTFLIPCSLQGWYWFLSPVQCHEPPSIVHQAPCLSDLVPSIYFSLLLYSHKGFDLGHTWMVKWFSPLSSISVWIW